ncbi:MAG: triose-phosphate isomerase [Oscillospiraceae bacterium]
MLVNAKAKALLTKGIMPIICVGESLEQREVDMTMEYVACQVKAALSGIDATQLRRCIIAYEPIWAIGTGKTATAEQAQEVCREHPCRYPQHLRRPSGTRRLHPLRRQHERKERGRAAAQPDIDGGLIGGAYSQARRLRHHNRGNRQE